MALWSLLVFVVSIGLHILSVCGDSQVIINWEKSVACLDVVDPEHWCDRITEVKSSFLSINFQHIYREHNMSADVLSKEALSLDMGKLSYIEMLDGESIGSDTIMFF